MTMNYAPCVMEAIRRGWITILARPKVSRATRLERQRECMARIRARRKLGRPIVPNKIPINRGMFPEGKEGKRQWFLTYKRIWDKEHQRKR